MNNVKDSIGWCDFSWNPVTGCKRRCPYCYARRNWNRLHRKREGCEFDEIRFHPNRLDDPGLWKNKGVKIFVDSMSDIEYWSPAMVRNVIDTCRTYYKNTFMFLSKSSNSYSGYTWPSNTMQGLTLTGAESTNTQHEKILNMQILPRPYLSIEPILGNIEIQIGDKFETVIAGAMTGPGAIVPQHSWIQSVKDNVPAAKIYWKKNIQKYLKNVP